MNYYRWLFVATIGLAATSLHAPPSQHFFGENSFTTADIPCIRMRQKRRRTSKATFRVIKGTKILAGSGTVTRIYEEVDRLSGVLGKACLAVIVTLVGDNGDKQVDSALASHLRQINRAAEKHGITCKVVKLSETATTTDAASIIDGLNEDPRVHGILLQLPLPARLEVSELLERIKPEKDVDALNPLNLGRLAAASVQFDPWKFSCGSIQMSSEEPLLTPALHEAAAEAQKDVIGRASAAKTTQNVVQRASQRQESTLEQLRLTTSAHHRFFVSTSTEAVLEIIRDAGVELIGARVAIVGRSLLTGTPLFLLLQRCGATLTACHLETPDLPRILRDMDVVISCCSAPLALKADSFASNATVIDVGIAWDVERSRLEESVDFDKTLGKVTALTPVPGGVGPVTIAVLFKHCFLAKLLLLPEQSVH